MANKELPYYKLRLDIPMSSQFPDEQGLVLEDLVLFCLPVAGARVAISLNTKGVAGARVAVAGARVAVAGARWGGKGKGSGGRGKGGDGVRKGGDGDEGGKGGGDDDVGGGPGDDEGGAECIGTCGAAIG
jgi:hypothetical protein